MDPEEQDENEDVPVPAYGYASKNREEADPGAIFLYVPDLSSETGWDVYRVRAGTASATSRRIGFRRR